MNYQACFAALAAMPARCHALAVGDIAEVTIIDRDRGVMRTPHRSNCELWVAARPGATYAISVRDRLDERVLAVTCVDGVANVGIVGVTVFGIRYDSLDNFVATGIVAQPHPTLHLRPARIPIA